MFNDCWKFKILDIIDLLNLICYIILIFRTKIWSWLGLFWNSIFLFFFFTIWNIRMLVLKYQRKKKLKVNHNLTGFKKKKTRMNVGFLSVSENATVICKHPLWVSSHLIEQWKSVVSILLYHFIPLWVFHYFPYWPVCSSTE